jgi:hypothetical protein
MTSSLFNKKIMVRIDKHLRDRLIIYWQSGWYYSLYWLFCFLPDIDLFHANMDNNNANGRPSIPRGVLFLLYH